jgi:hypothetical protein
MYITPIKIDAIQVVLIYHFNQFIGKSFTSIFSA